MNDAVEEIAETWSRFAADVGAFEEQVAVARSAAAPARVHDVERSTEVLTPLGRLVPTFRPYPYEAADAAAESSEALEEVLFARAGGVEPSGSGDLPLTSGADREIWRLEAMLLASATVDASLAADAFELERLSIVERERLGPGGVEPIDSSTGARLPSVGEESSAGALVPGGTTGLLAAAAPLFSSGNEPGSDPLPYRLANAHALAAEASRLGGMPAQRSLDYIDKALLQMLEASYASVQAFAVAPVRALAWQPVPQELRTTVSAAVEALLVLQGPKRPAVRFVVRCMCKLARAVGLADSDRLERVLGELDTYGLSRFLSRGAPLHAKRGLARLAEYDAARARIAAASRKMPADTWRARVWAPVADDLLPRYRDRQALAGRIAKAVRIIAPVIIGLAPPFGPAGVIAISATGVGYSAVCLADGYDAQWLRTLWRHQGLPSLLEARFH